MNELIEIIEVHPNDVKRIESEPPPEPHRHDFEELIVGIEGMVEHFIDFQTEQFAAPFISFVSRQKTHRFIPKTLDGKCHILGIRFKSEFIPETTFHLYSLFHNNANLSLKADSCFDRIEQICSIMQDELKQSNPDLGVIRHLLSALFVMIESERQKQKPETKQQVAQNETYTTFLQILEENFRRPEGVEYYAERLFMSSRNLNHITQKMFSQSVSEIIETRKLIEAKNLLTSTDKTISEISFELGYNEKSYFSKVFKKKSGQTPSEFRDEMRKLV
ncbi:helix-turn-helix domain-containing protein [Reichenbachiella versicolor]|uniref:helix-turn-helix domain-containing protein n=1 Tax=Reichenbachiella versicolor TaxID=1821036 RepID=UPI000D6E0705|nr:AraC family transcriptional regulator [Reichenbachiella versicolor]